MAKFLMMEKLDGSSIRLTYQDGHLTEMVTRGDGTLGDNITPHAQHIPSIPKTITLTGTVHIRGEMVLPKAAHQEVFKPRGIVNPRNGCVGIMKGKSPPEDLQHLTLVAFELHAEQRPTTVAATLELLLSQGFSTPLLTAPVDQPQDADFIFQRYLDHYRQTLPWATDGMIITINDHNTRDKAQIRDGRPDHTTAVKPPPPSVLTKVLGITWSQAISGAFTPVLNLEPADMGGDCILRNVNLFNLDNLKLFCEQGLNVGAIVEVERAGDVIPHLVRVVVPVWDSPNETASPG